MAYRSLRVPATCPLRGLLTPLLVLALFTLLAPAMAADPIPADPPLRWWKGNLHTHTLWSDGNDFPEMVAEWYRTHDYNFLALSDHNILSEGQRWMSAAAIAKRGGDQVVPKYSARFGPSWVEVRNASTGGEPEYRLKPLDEFRALVEERGKFIMLVGEEISDSVNGAPLHLNATNLQQLLQPLGGESIPAALRANLRAAEDQATRLGREIIVHLNHPNFHYAITADDLAQVLEERFFEVYNGHPGVNHLGDADHPGVERIWDLANTLRITHWRAAPLMGVATDDSHAYHDAAGATPGRGWIMVRARHLSPESLVRAIKLGDFYASSGVVLEEINFVPATQTVTVSVAPQPQGVSCRIDFIGSRLAKPPAANDQNAAPASAIGVTLATVHDQTTASYTLQPDDLYVRAVVTSSAAHPNPSFADQRQQAWTQPVGWEQRLK